jgi:hypothetical protein
MVSKVDRAHRKGPFGLVSGFGLIVGLLLVPYVGSYYHLSRRGMQEARPYNMQGFFYVPADEVWTTQDLSRHYFRMHLYAPLNWLDQTLFGGDGPVRGITWGLFAVPQLQWLDRYNGQTVEELIALEGEYRIDSLVLAFEQAMDQKAARIGDDKLTDEERIILAVEALEREVNNGGYGQFFVNSREYAPIIVNALRRIGCPKTAEITQKALKIVQKTPLTDEEIEQGTWEDNKERQEALGECDTMYFERPEYIEDRLFAFIKANRTKIKP